MKNIHVLSTDKPSRLRITSKGKLILSTIAVGSKEETQNIYITSDEEIKEGDWYVNTLDEVVRKNNTINHSYHKKIILTTDQDLIKDGVQAIDDEFLKWFVKNPSCEEVKVEGHLYKGQDETEYKIIIPKEERERGITITHVGKQEQDSCNYCGKKLKDQMKGCAEITCYRQFLPKQETLVEVKDLAYWKVNAEEDYIKVPISVLRYISELEKQQERSYSEEEVENMINDFDASQILFNEKYTYKVWFEQFKKKIK